MKQAVRRLLEHVPGGLMLLEVYRSWRFRRWAGRFGCPEALFTHYYETNFWGSGESRSGAGSTVEYTENVRRGLADLIRQLGVRRLLDAPCGDYHWFRLVPRADDVLYIGGDIVGPLVARNQELYGSETTRFIQLDITRDRLPDADLWLCRDALFHLSNRDIFLTLDNFLRSNIRSLLTSSHPGCAKNRDVPTGSFRLINLERPPFNFGQPLLSIEDRIEGFPPRSLCLWDRPMLAQTLAGNRELARIARERR